MPLVRGELRVQNHLRLRTAALGNPVCYTIGASELKAYGERPFFISRRNRQISYWKNPRVPLLLPDAKTPVLQRKAALSQVRAGRTGWGWGQAVLGSAKGISGLLKLMLCASELLIQAMPQTCTPPNELC